MAIDARIAVGLPQHPKTKKLIKRLGQAAAWNLVCLILWAAANRSDGDLVGLSTEDIELAADWTGEDGAFVAALIEVRFLDAHIDQQRGGYLLHDWQEHNPWAAGADLRSSKARWNAIKKHHGGAEADRQVPEYAATRIATSTATSTMSADIQQDSSNANSASSMLAADTQHDTSSAPSPSPSPSLTPNVLTSIEVNARARAAPPPDGVPDAVWKDFKKLRSAKKAPVTETAMAGIAREADKAGLSLSDALAMCCERGWSGFKAKWLDRDAPSPAARDSPAESFSERDERRAQERYREAIGQSIPPKNMGEIIDITPARLTQ